MAKGCEVRPTAGAMGIILPSGVGSYQGVTWCSHLGLENLYQWGHHTQRIYFPIPSDNNTQQITEEATAPWKLLAVRHPEDKVLGEDQFPCRDAGG